MTGRRTTCLYCEQEDGTQTPLVEVQGFRCCPIHSAGYIERNRPRTVLETLEREGKAPTLLHMQRKTRPQDE